MLAQIKPSEFQVARISSLQEILQTGFQDSQLVRLAPFSWSDFVEYMKAERSGRRKSSRRVGIEHSPL